VHYLFFVAFFLFSPLSCRACNVDQGLPRREIPWKPLREKRLQIRRSGMTEKEQEAELKKIYKEQKATNIIALADTLQRIIYNFQGQPDEGISIAYCFKQPNHAGGWHLLFPSHYPLIVEEQQYNNMRLSGLETGALLAERNKRLELLLQQNFNTELKDLLNELNLIPMLYEFFDDRKNLFTFDKHCLCNTEAHFLDREDGDFKVEPLTPEDIEKICSNQSLHIAYDWILPDTICMPKQRAHDPADDSLISKLYDEGRESGRIGWKHNIAEAVYGVGDDKEEPLSPSPQKKSKNQSDDDEHDNEPADVAKKPWPCCRML
jgi:hypothetical protein